VYYIQHKFKCLQRTWLYQGSQFTCSVRSVCILEAEAFLKLIFDPTYPMIDFNNFKAAEEWTLFYGDKNYIIPPNAPEPRGKPFKLRHHVDSDDAGNLVIRRMKNMSVIIWYSKKQGSI
jgi:hypothetical protein